MTLVFQSIIDLWMREKEGEMGRKGKERRESGEEGRGEYMNPRCYILV